MRPLKIYDSSSTSLVRGRPSFLIPWGLSADEVHHRTTSTTTSATGRDRSRHYDCWCTDWRGWCTDWRGWRTAWHEGVLQGFNGVQDLTVVIVPPSFFALIRSALASDRCNRVLDEKHAVGLAARPAWSCSHPVVQR